MSSWLRQGRTMGPYGAGWPADLLDVRTVPDSHDWGYWHEYGQGRSFMHSRAKVLGGCSAHNEAGFVWALPEVYDSWATRFGDESWSYKELQPMRDAIEASTTPSEWHGVSGMLETTPYDRLTQWSEAFLHAAQDAGHPRLPDFSDPDPAGGVAVWHANIKGTTRWNASFAFVDPHRGDARLRILDHVRIDRLEFIGSSGVIAAGSRGGTAIRIAARAFVLASGAVGTPEILLRSGIGPVSALSRLGIEVVADVPAVGNGLTDHIGIPLDYRLNPDAQARFDADRATGHFFHCQVVTRTATGYGQGDFFNLLPYERTFDGQTWHHMLIAFLVSPDSSGRVELVSADSRVPPAVNAGYLTDPDDRDTARLKAGVIRLREIAASEHIRRLLTQMHHVRDSDLEDYIHTNFLTYGHLMSSCRMGGANDTDAAITPDGLVKGTDNVFVVDASAIPAGFTAATNATAMLLGYKLAQSAVKS
ncbi:GMC family oxidoreductase [Kibdelosporangium aridum]|uniref:GMC family oxidoreductase n=1 Tax=Kibdelosporangium aridum TaxID=2030 RepID=UPI0035EC3770